MNKNQNADAQSKLKRKNYNKKIIEINNILKNLEEKIKELKIINTIKEDLNKLNSDARSKIDPDLSDAQSKELINNNPKSLNEINIKRKNLEKEIKKIKFKKRKTNKYISR